MITIDANERFTPVEQCRMFNVDMSELMDPKDIRGNNKFLLESYIFQEAFVFPVPLHVRQTSRRNTTSCPSAFIK